MMNYEHRASVLCNSEKQLFNRQHVSFECPKKELVETEKDIYHYYGHCDHCPTDDAWYLNIHLFMEDENFSAASGALAYFIMLLIGLSTFTYVFQTLPEIEAWDGWQVLEGLVSIIFTIEFIVRAASCRDLARYMQDSMNLVDFCAIIPFWIELAAISGLDTRLLRVIRVVRLLRLIRLTKVGGVQDIFLIYQLTIKATGHWLMMFAFIGGVIVICVASFEYILEVGTKTIVINCEMTFGSYCDGGSMYEAWNVRDVLSCENNCEQMSLIGCCAFDQITGHCEFYNSTAERIALTSYSSGPCRTDERLLRIDDTESPYYAITNSFWWAYVTMIMVGYGDFWPITEQGQLCALIAATIGLMFLAFPVIIVGFHFTMAQVSTRYAKLPPIVDNKLEAAQRGTIIQVLEQVNEDMGMRIFQPEDVVVFLTTDSQINSREKLEQILRYNGGWAYLPFSYDSTPGLPRITQFKLFVLFALFGRRLQHERSAKKRRDQQFIKQLKELEKFNRERGTSTIFPKRRGSSSAGKRSSLSVHHSTGSPHKREIMEKYSSPHKLDELFEEEDTPNRSSSANTPCGNRPDDLSQLDENEEVKNSKPVKAHNSRTEGSVELLDLDVSNL